MYPPWVAVRLRIVAEHFLIGYDYNYFNLSKNSATGEWKSAQQFLSPLSRIRWILGAAATTQSAVCYSSS